VSFIKGHAINLVALAGLAALVSACSPSPSSGGSSETRREIIVLPPGSTVVCPSGKAPPC